MEEYKEHIDNGIYKIQDGKYKEALEDINKSIELKNDWDISYFYRGVVYQALDEFDNAMIDYTKAIQLNPKMVDAYYNRARIILTRKDIDSPNIQGAISDLEKALELDEKFIDALYAIAAAYKRIGDYHKSLVYLERLLKLEPDAINARALKKLILQKYIV